MQPGLSRAIPMGIIGFMVGALLVIVLRGLQGLDPLWAPGPGIVLSVIMTAAFFVWGIGAFDSRLSIHGDEALEEAVHEELAAESEKPRSLLTSTVWQLATGLLVLLILVGGFAALPGGLALTQTVVPDASPTSVGMVPFQLPFGGPEVMVSQLVIFAAFTLWALLSLVVVAGILAYIFSYLSRGLVEIRAAGGGTVALPPPVVETPAPRDARTLLTTIVLFAVVFIVLYFIFFYVAIGLIFPQPQLPGLSIILPDPTGQLVFLSLVNAALFTLIILRPTLVLHTIGRVARWVAYQLRRIPNILQ